MGIVRVIIQKAPSNYGAFLPDIDGIVTVGDTIEEIKKNMKEAIDLSLEVMEEIGEPIPEQLQGEYELAYEMDFQTMPKRCRKSNLQHANVN